MTTGEIVAKDLDIPVRSLAPRSFGLAAYGGGFLGQELDCGWLGGRWSGIAGAALLAVEQARKKVGLLGI